MACAALLPCFWLYMHVGETIVGSAAPANPYQAWIDMYAGDAFGANVRTMQVRRRRCRRGVASPCQVSSGSTESAVSSVRADVNPVK